MARRNRRDDESINQSSLNNDKGFRRQLSNISNLIGQANLSLYGTDRTSDIDNLNSKFQDLLNNEIGDLTNRTDGDITSFLGQIISSDNKSTAADEILNNQFMAMSGDEYSTMQSFIYDAYRNRLLEQSDLHEVSSQLIELSEAILITRDAIISADVVEGRMSRSFIFENLDDEDVEDNTSINLKIQYYPHREISTDDIYGKLDEMADDNEEVIDKRIESFYKETGKEIRIAW